MGMLPAAVASADVKWSARAEWGPTSLPPGGKAQFVLYATNVGTSSSNGGISIVDHLPSGVVVTGLAPQNDLFGSINCSGISTSTVTCNAAGAAGIDPGHGGQGSGLFVRQIVIVETRVSPSASGVGSNTLTVSGGGAPNPAVDTAQIPFGNVANRFGITPSTYTGDVADSPYPLDASPARQAGSHPGDLRLTFGFNLSYRQVSPSPEPGATYLPYTTPAGKVRTVVVTLPRGLIGNPEAVPKCNPLDFLSTGQEEWQTTGCPPDTQVGSLNVELGNGGEGFFEAGDVGSLATYFPRVSVYNLQPPKGTPVDLGFQVGGFAVGHIYASLDPSRDYAITAESPLITDIVPIHYVRVTQWGVPGDPAHDLFRAQSPVLKADGYPDGSLPAFGASFTSLIKPFFTLPFDCGVDNGGVRISADSWNEPGQFTEPLEDEHHLDVTGCEDERIRFHPQTSLQPTSRAAGGPTGLQVNLEVPQRDQTVEDYEELYPQNGNLHGIDTPPIKKAVVTLPQGMTLSTSAAQGLSGCTPEEIGLGNNNPVTCPDSSQYGTLTLNTPLLPKDEPMHGYIYIAQQSHNPFGTFLALYLVIEDQDRGLRVKIPGRIDLDPKTGQITTTFDDLPQFPVSDFQLTLKGGVRAGLVNPPTCGEKQITATFYSWADPSTPVTRTSSYGITEKPDGSPCVNDLGERPFAPQMSAGTVSNSAGTYSPFAFRLTRTDEDQEFSQLQTTLPPGLSAKIAGLSRCPEAAIAQAEARTAAGDGALEQLFPSCPASSQIGATEVGSGVGQVLTYIPGKVYLAGPYRGAPLSMVVISPIVTGPYDLGVIAVRAAIEVDPQSAQVTVKSDPLPQIYQGIPVRIRDIRVKVDRPDTTVNPTSCEQMQVGAHLTGTGGDLESTQDDSAADLAQRFQAADCASLAFKPKLSLKLLGGTHRGGHPALRATLLTGGSPQANISRTEVTLPTSEFLDQGHLNNVCSRALYSAGPGGGAECPPGSIYGHARAMTPLLDQPLEGPVYLRSDPGRELPDLVFSLNGAIHVDLVGFIDSVHGGIRTRFESVPDAPVSKFVLTMGGGKKSLLENSTNLCLQAHRATVILGAHNGMSRHTHPALSVACKGKGRKRR